MIPKKPNTKKEIDKFIKKGGQLEIKDTDEPKATLHIQIPRSLHDKLKITAASERKYVRNIVIDAIKLYFKSRSMLDDSISSKS